MPGKGWRHAREERGERTTEKTAKSYRATQQKGVEEEEEKESGIFLQSQPKHKDNSTYFLTLSLNA